MEVERPRPQANVQEQFQPGSSELDELPPPPLPFPTEQLRRLSDGTLSNAVVSDAARAAVVSTTEAVPKFHEDHIPPPSYTAADQRASHESHRTELPEYECDDMASEPDGSESRSLKKGTRGHTSEKLLRDFDDVTDAIDRLHSVAPQLDNQRMAFRSESNCVASSSTARQSIAPVSEAERSRLEKEKWKELEKLWDQIERAHGKGRMRTQSVNQKAWSKNRQEQRERYLRGLFESSETDRMDNQDSSMSLRKVDAELARARDLRDRDGLYQDLLDKADEGRLIDQDALHTEDSASTRENKRQLYLAELMDRMREGRLEGQDSPDLTSNKMSKQREKFIGSLVELSSAGRLHDQDSLPPTPKAEFTHDPMELVTVQDFFKDRRRSVPELKGDQRLGEEEKKMNGFSRLRGLVRKSSMGLKLKPTAGLNASEISYISEHQENLNIVQVMLHGTGINDSDLCIQTDKVTDDEAIIVSQKETFNLHIVLPTRVRPDQQSPFVRHGFHLEAKIAALPVASTGAISSLNTIIPHALSASELHRTQPNGFCCASCDRELVDLAPNEICKDLPSEHWAEMLEVWMCHPDPAFTSHLADKTKDGFWPVRGTTLVGGSYLLVDGSQVKAHNVVMSDTKDEADRQRPILSSPTQAGWTVISCSCGEVLGKRRKDDGRPGAGAVRLSKWAVALLREDDEGESVEPLRYPLSVFVTADMLELAQAHASYRFVIVEEETQIQRVNAWLFNPSVRISYRRAPSAPQPSPARSLNGNGSIVEKRRSIMGSSNRSGRTSAASTASTLGPGIAGWEGSPKTLRAAKIMYKVIGGSDRTDSSTKPKQSLAPQQEEILTYPRQVCDRLVAALRESTALYPLERRTMGGYEVGFLERV